MSDLLLSFHRAFGKQRDLLARLLALPGSISQVAPARFMRMLDALLPKRMTHFSAEGAVFRAELRSLGDQSSRAYANIGARARESDAGGLWAIGSSQCRSGAALTRGSALQTFRDALIEEGFCGFGTRTPNDAPAVSASLLPNRSNEARRSGAFRLSAAILTAMIVAGS